MCPIDPTPHAGEVLHEPEKQFPEPTPAEKRPGKHPGVEPQPGKHPDAPMNDRPPIPPTSELMGVDVEDEEDDPVVESGPGVDTRSG